MSRSIALLRDVVGHHEGVATARTQAVGFEPSRPLTARSVIATALLGAPNGRLPVSHLVQAGRLLGIADGGVLGPRIRRTMVKLKNGMLFFVKLQTMIILNSLAVRWDLPASWTVLGRPNYASLRGK